MCIICDWLATKGMKSALSIADRNVLDAHVQGRGGTWKMVNRQEREDGVVRWAVGGLAGLYTNEVLTRGGLALQHCSLYEYKVLNARYHAADYFLLTAETTQEWA